MSANHEWRVARRWFAASGILVLVIVATPSAGIDMIGGGYAVQFVSLFLVLTCLAGGGVYVGRGRVLDAILKGDRVLAEWRYEPGRYPAYAEADLKGDRSHGWMLLAIVAFFCVFWGGIAWWSDPEAGPIVGLVLLGTFGACGAAFTWNTTWRHRRLAGRSLSRAVVSDQGVYLEPQLFEWKSFGTRLDGVARQTTRGEDVLVFAISSRAGSAPRNDCRVRVPVPHGERATADRIVSTLNTRRRR